MPRSQSPNTNDRIALRQGIETFDRALLESTLASLSVGILVTDREHLALACNRTFGNIFSVDLSRVVTSDVEQVRDMVRERIVNPERWERNLHEVYLDEGSTHIDKLHLKNPHKVVDRITSPVHNASGEVIGRLWTFIDVTEEDRLFRMRDTLYRAASQFPREPREAYTAITRLLGDFYQSTSILSIRKEDFMEFRAVGGPIEAAYGLPGNNLADAYCQFCLSTDGPTLIQDARKEKRSENLLPVTMGITRYAGVPVRLPEGEVVGTLCILDDRSDEPLDGEDSWFLEILAAMVGRELGRERQLAELQQDLGEAQERVVQNEKLATAGTLAASIAHDIRNILSTLSLEISMGKSRPAETLVSVQTQLDRFSLLAHRLMSYAKPAAFARDPVSLKESISRVSQLVSSHLTVGEIRLVVDQPPSDPVITGDPGRIDHLVVNLCLNAVQSMKPGGVLKITLDHSVNTAVLSVSDTGQGIAPEELDQLFQPFRTDKQNGFGLGLYSCSQIAKEAGGSISVSSVPGEGTEFVVRFPLHG